MRAQSLDPRGRREQNMDFDFNEPPCKTPVLCNKYAMEDIDDMSNGKRSNMRCQSMPRQPSKFAGGEINRYNTLSPNQWPSHYGSSYYNQYNHQPQHQQHQLYRQPDEDFEVQQPVKKNKRRERHGSLEIDLVFNFYFIASFCGIMCCLLFGFFPN